MSGLIRLNDELNTMLKNGSLLTPNKKNTRAFDRLKKTILYYEAVEVIGYVPENMTWYCKEDIDNVVAAIRLEKQFDNFAWDYVKLWHKLAIFRTGTVCPEDKHGFLEAYYEKIKGELVLECDFCMCNYDRNLNPIDASELDLEPASMAVVQDNGLKPFQCF